MKRLWTQRRNGRKGAGMAEFALVSLAFLLISPAMVEFARLV